jgi:hypothetical protein
MLNTEIRFTNRPSDFIFDLYVCGEWIASAMCYHTADEIITALTHTYA